MKARTKDLFVTVPKTVLPGGLVVPQFKVGQYHASRAANDSIAITADGAPLININYHEAVSACEKAGYQLIRESQALALAYQIALQDENWTGGKVGAGKLYQGLRKGSINRAMPGNYTPTDPDERTWFALPDGQRIYNVAGNLYTWVLDDVQGDKKGLIAKPFAKDSPSIVIPYPAEDKGQGWTPRAGSDWSGLALIRGGCWHSDGCAGVFRLDGVWPDGRNVDVGVRCTLPDGR